MGEGEGWPKFWEWPTNNWTIFKLTLSLPYVLGRGGWMAQKPSINQHSYINTDNLRTKYIWFLIKIL